MNERELLIEGLERCAPDYPPQAVDNLLSFSERLREANLHMNLTAITEPNEIVTRHFLDCAVLAPMLRQGARVLDLGTGAGFPGVPLAVLTGAEFTLLDAQRKRVDFLNETLAALGVKNARAVHARAEEFAAENRESFDFVTSRAVAELNQLCELALPLLRMGGVFLAMKAADCEQETENALNAVKVLGSAPPEIIRLRPPFSEAERAVVCMEKIAPTPAAYPRRFAKIRSKPL